MHPDVQWKCTGRAVLHLPNGGGPDSCTQWPSRFDEQPPEHRPPTPVCLWWVHQPENADCAVLVFCQFVLLCCTFPVEGSGVGCPQVEPVAAQDTPAGDTRLTVLPYHQVIFNVDFISWAERFVVFHLIFIFSFGPLAVLLQFSYSR